MRILVSSGRHQGLGTAPPCPSTMGHASGARAARPAIHPHAPRDLRHRARELPLVVLPSHGARGDRRRACARVRHQQRAARHARRHVFLRVHGAAGAGWRAGGHVGTPVDPGGGLARRGARLHCIRARAVVGNRGRRPHARRRRRLGRVHRDPQGERGMVPRQPVRDVERRHDVRRQSRRGDRGRAARLARHANVVARRLPGARGAVDRARRCILVQGARPAGGPGISAGALAARVPTKHDALGAGGGVAYSRIRPRGRDSSSMPASPAAISLSPASGRSLTSSRRMRCRA